MERPVDMLNVPATHSFPRGFIEQYIIVVPSEYIEGIFSNQKSLIHGPLLPTASSSRIFRSEKLN
jgi:hypothetical protein